MDRGHVIEVSEPLAGYHRGPGPLVRVWYVHGAVEAAVDVVPEPDMPRPGEPVWVRAGRLVHAGGQRSLAVVGKPYDPRPAARAASPVRR